MKGLFLKLMLVMLFLNNVRTADLDDLSSCGSSTPDVINVHFDGGKSEELEAFLAAHSKDLEGKNVVIETIITPTHSQTTADIATTQIDSITSSAASPTSTVATTSTSTTAATSTCGCEVTSSHGCFWAKLIERGSINLTGANNTCTSHGAVLAVIRDQDTYDKIVEMGREELKKKSYMSWTYAELWLGMTYDPAKREIYPEGSIEEPWSKNFPKDESASTRVLVSVSTDASSAYQGLKNRSPSAKKGGVVCQKPSTC